MNKAYQSVASINQKLNLQKVNFNEIEQKSGVAKGDKLNTLILFIHS